MKAIKILGGVAALVILVVLGLVFYVFGNINQLVKQAVETVGPEVTETRVELRDVDIKLTQGKGELNNFVIGNPEGFTSEHLLKWDTIRLQIDPSSVRSDVIVIKDFTIGGVEIIAEQKGYTTNIQALLDTLQSGSSNESSTKENESNAGEADVRLMLEKLKFSDNSVNFVTEKYGDYTLDLPSFDLNNIGDKQTGLTPEELGVAILQPLLKQAKRAVEDRIKNLAKEELEAKLAEKKEELEQKVDEEKAKLEEKLKKEEAKLDDQKKELKDKLEKDAKKKLKGLFDKD